MYPTVFGIIIFATLVILCGAAIKTSNPQRFDELWNYFTNPKAPSIETLKHNAVILVVSAAILKFASILTRKS
jgi:hypothetical protein